MKLKYFMRGLGLGIILTTLIFSLTKTEEKLTDKEIMDRARALGMVTEEESNQELDEFLKEIKPTGSIIKPSPTPAPTVEVEPTPEVTVAPTEAPTVAPTEAPTVAPTRAPEQETVKNINFTIKSGMTSDQVAQLLVEVGLIEDAKAFNNYIINQGKASVIRVGTYSLPQDSSYSNIVKEITTKN